MSVHAAAYHLGYPDFRRSKRSRRTCRAGRLTRSAPDRSHRHARHGCGSQLRDDLFLSRA